MLTYNQDVQPLTHLKKKDIAMPGNLMTGLPVSGLMILGLQLQDGCARAHTVPSDTHGSRSGLHTINWIEISNRKISETFLVLWFYDRIWPLQQIFCVRNLRNRNLLGKLHYSLSNNTTMFNHG